MGTVPNRYYNSPWIAQAAGNLTDALFGSPERDAARLQAQRTEFEMERANRADADARVEQQRQLADRTLSDAVRAKVQAKYQTYTDKTDPKVFNAELAGIAAEAPDMPLDKVIQIQQRPEMYDALIAGRAAVANIGATTSRENNIRTNNVKYQLGMEGYRNETVQAVMEMEEARAGRALEWDKATLEAAVKREEARQRALSGGLKMNPSDSDYMRKTIADLQNSHGKVSPELAAAMLMKSEQNWMTGLPPGTAAHLAWSDTMGPGPYKKLGGFWGESTIGPTERPIPELAAPLMQQQSVTQPAPTQQPAAQQPTMRAPPVQTQPPVQTLPVGSETPPPPGTPPPLSRFKGEGHRIRDKRDNLLWELRDGVVIQVQE